ncbi:MAG: hypothetical protein CR979_00800 [Propionibacterium sp.]|nr:MAG: hypothetical protein CR979_00800 [Propionibacterium sp.]
MGNKEQPPRRRRPLGVTSKQQIMVAVLSGAAFSYLLLVIADIFNQIPPLVPWSLSLLLVVISLPTYFYARRLPTRIENQELTPEEGVRAMILGKSMLMTGCILAGGHLVYVLKWIAYTEIPGPFDRVTHGTVAVMASVVFALVGSALEKACIVDINDENDLSKGAPA